MPVKKTAGDSQVIFYQTEDGNQRIEVRLEKNTVWLSQKLIAELFGIKVNTVNYHIQEIYKSKELKPEATIRKYRIVQNEGNRQVTRNVEFYNLEVIIAIGYRVQYVLKHAGVISSQLAKEVSLMEYEKFEKYRDAKEVISAEQELNESILRLTSNKERNEKEDLKRK